jgi:ribonuclease HI
MLEGRAPSRAWLIFPKTGTGVESFIFDEGFHETTNDRMELWACIRALEYVADKGKELM